MAGSQRGHFIKGITDVFSSFESVDESCGRIHSSLKSVE